MIAAGSQDVPVIAAGSKAVPVLAAGSQAMVPGTHAWMEVTSLPSVVVKSEKCAVTFSSASSVSHMRSNR